MTSRVASHPLIDAIRRGDGPLTRAVRHAGLSALGTYTAYVAYGLRHPELLRPKSQAADASRPLPGDDVVADPDWVTNFTTTIDAPASTVWPWLVQIGYGRAGWYTWYPLDNGGTPSACRIVPELQRLAVGDLIPDGPRAAEGLGVWRVLTLEPRRALVLHSRRTLLTGREIPAGEMDERAFVDCTWAFVLEETEPFVTRLHVRVRARAERMNRALARGLRALFGFGDNVMQRTLLDGIKRRAEGFRS